MRWTLYCLLTSRYSTPGSWEHIVREKGLFSLLALSEDQMSNLRTEHHIYLPKNGRINIAGLSEGNIERFATAVDAVIRRARTPGSMTESRI
jgi:aspartate aminotransferase, cytoplasmic